MKKNKGFAGQGMDELVDGVIVDAPVPVKQDSKRYKSRRTDEWDRREIKERSGRSFKRAQQHRQAQEWLGEEMEEEW